MESIVNYSLANALGQGWGTYLLQWVAWVVDYHWRATKI